MMDAATALQYGLVNHVINAEELMPKATELMELILTKAPLAVARCIQAANAAGSPEGYATELEGFGDCFQLQSLSVCSSV
jgi:enoyl-CoA hydratase